jgi:hypothetical protein
VRVLAAVTHQHAPVGMHGSTGVDMHGVGCICTPATHVCCSLAQGLLLRRFVAGSSPTGTPAAALAAAEQCSLQQDQQTYSSGGGACCAPNTQHKAAKDQYKPQPGICTTRHTTQAQQATPTNYNHCLLLVSQPLT